ncbi:glycosyltransferase family 2 protein [Vibrio parahaemolyticus]
MNAAVSIVMPSYNSANTIIESIESILAQTYKNWELIIVDDCSSDNTWDILSEYSNLYENIHIYRNEKNEGAAVSRNIAINKSQGRFIAFLDSDDLWTEDKLCEQIDFMLTHGYSFTYTYYTRFNAKGETTEVAAPNFTTYEKLLYSNVIGCLTAMYDTEAVGKVFMPLIRKRQDMGLWLNILKVTPKAYCLAKPLAYYRADSGMTSNKIKVLSYQWKFYRNIVGLGLLKSSYLFVFYAINGIMKHK